MTCSTGNPIVSPLDVAEGVMLARLPRDAGERMLMLDTSVAGVSEEFGVGMDDCLRLPQEPKIMRRPAARGDAEDPARDRIYQELQFQRVALLFPTVPVPLFFLGRSHGTSLTSITTAVNTAPASLNVLFPGSENCPLRNSASSTRTTVRRTVVSWMLQS